jgi:hypothetical protein
MTTGDIIWEDPPPPGSGTRGPTRAIADKLRAQPGKWARVAGPLETGVAESLRVSLVQGRASGVKPGEFEASRRKLEDGVYVWARYVGDGND